MADKEKCFEYVIDIPATGAVTTGSKFTIDTASTCTGSDDEVTAGTPAKVYLKHGDTVTVGVNNGKNQLPIGAGYTITNNAHENYTSKIDGTEQDSVTKTTAAVDDSNFNTQNKTSIENNYDSNPITGIVTNFWFYLVLLMIGAFGVFFIIARRRDDDEEEA